MTYIPGVHADDPGHWPLAYTRATIVGQSFVAVFQHDGQIQTLEPAAFEKYLADFKQEYEQARGKPPVITEAPPAAGQP